MSSAINVYAVSIERLQQLFGSRDQSLIDAVVAEQEDFLASIDDIDDEAEMTCADALAELVNGETAADGPGYLYGYALEAICAHLGEVLPNICPIAGGSDWIEEVDAILESQRVPVRLEGLVYGGSPVPIPEPDDYPFIGNWPAAEVARALAAFRSLDLTEIDDEIAETMKQMRTWLEAAAKTPGTSVIGFLS